MASGNDRLIKRVAGVQGGEPIVAGTRTPVRTIVELVYRVYPGEPSEVMRALPHLTQEQVDAALAYYRDHQCEIDQDIERHQKVLQDLAAS